MVTLVSNTGQTALGSPPAFGTSAIAQKFTTGSKASLDSVKVHFSAAPATLGNLSVEIWSNASSHPDEKIAGLNRPSSMSDNSLATFTPISPITLGKGRDYWIVLSYTPASGESAADYPKASLTDSDNEDSASLDDWEVANGYFYRPRTDTGPWTGATRLEQSVLIEVHGTPIFPPKPITLFPVALSADGSQITVKFDKNLHRTNLPSLSSLSVEADGVAIRKSDLSVNVNNRKQLLVTFSPNPIRRGQAVSIAYEDPTAGNDANAIQDTDGNDTEDFTLSFTSTTGPQPSAPSKPRNLSATADGPSRIDLAWDPPTDNGGRVITGYRIQSSPDGSSGSWTDLVTNTGNTGTTYADTAGISHGTTRHYRVSALNSAGTSDPSDSDSATALDTNPPKLSTVGDIVAVLAPGVAIALAFDEDLDGSNLPPADAFTILADGDAITIGKIERGSGRHDELYLLQLSPVIRQGETVTVAYEDPTAGDDDNAIQDAAGNDTADFSRTAVNNSTVAPGAPGAPRNLEATADGQSRIDLAWDPPTDDGGRTVTGYRIEYHDGACTTPYTGASTVLATDTGSDDTEFTDNGGGNGLAPATTRCYRAYAINSEGTGTDASNEDAATTDATKPGAPGALMAAVNGRQVTLSWTTPADGGSAITEYEYRQSTDGEMNWTVWMDISGSGPTTTSHPVSDLMGNTDYTFEVRAVNAVGNGAEASVDAMTPVVAVLEQGTTYAGAGNGRVFLRFKPPTDDGGGVTVSYRFRVKEGVGAYGNWTNIAEADLQAQSGGRLGYQVSGLTTIDHADRTVPSGYSFELQAVNSAGNSPASQVGVTPYRYRFELAARNWTQSQTADGFEEGSDVGFTLWIKTTPSSDCAFALPWKARWTATDPGGFVSGPKSGIQSFGACQASINFDVPTDDDVDNEAAHGEVTVALSGAGVIQDEPDRLYVGDTPPSLTFTVLDDDDDRPTRPTDLTAVPDENLVNLGWTAGGPGGGGAITKHQYCQKVGSGVCAPTDWTDIPDSAPDGANATSFTVTDLDNGTTYTFRVRAANAHGEGAASNAKSATPREVTPPGRPTRPAPGDGDGYATLQWGPPEDDGGRPVLGYEYRRRCSGSSDPECEWEPIPNSAPGEANEESYTIGNLQNGGRYVYQVRAVNERGPGPHVQLEMRPQAGAPPTPGNFRVDSHPPRSLRLSWTEPQAGTGITILAYDVHRQDNDSGGLYAPGLTGFISGFGPKRVTHCYRIRTIFELAEGVHGLGAYSPWECATAEGGPGADERVGIGVSTAEARESRDTVIEFPVSLTMEAEETVMATYRTNDVTAKAGEDYEATSGTLTFAPGETRKTVTVPLTDDHIEDPWEIFTLELVSVTGAEMRHAVATGTVHNTENATPSSIAVADAEADEGGTLDFVVALEPAATGTVTVDYETADGTATAGADYTAASGTLTFQAGETEKTIAVPVTDDDAEDQGETFTLTLSNASGARIADAEATGTIRNAEAQQESGQNTPAAGSPTINGTAQVGETLTADASDIADADGLTSVSYSYQWTVNDGTTDTDIQDATGSTYTPSVGDVGKTIKVRVSFTDDGGNAESRSSTATAPVAAAVPTEPLRLTVSEGNQIKGLDASWHVPSSDGGSAITGYRVQWKEAADSWDTAADVSEATATGTSHTITGLTGGVEYAVRVIATNGAGDGPASSEATGTPDGGGSGQNTEPENNAPTGLPTISGTAQVDETLTADASDIADADGLNNASFSYQWLADDANIQGAIGSTYTLVDSDEGKTIKVKVSFTDDAGNKESLTSAATGAVAPGSVPDRPTGLSNTATHDSVTLAWDDPEDSSITHYQLFRRDRAVDDLGVFHVIKDNTGSAATTYTDSTVDAEGSYVYRVKAVNRHGASLWSGYSRADV